MSEEFINSSEPKNFEVEISETKHKMTDALRDEISLNTQKKKYHMRQQKHLKQEVRFASSLRYNQKAPKQKVHSTNNNYRHLNSNDNNNWKPQRPLSFAGYETAEHWSEMIDGPNKSNDAFDLSVIRRSPNATAKKISQSESPSPIDSDDKRTQKQSDSHVSSETNEVVDSSEMSEESDVVLPKLEDNGFILRASNYIKGTEMRRLASGGCVFSTEKLNAVYSSFCYCRKFAVHFLRA